MNRKTYRIIGLVIVAILLLSIGLSACNADSITGLFSPAEILVSRPAIFSPPDQVRVVVNSPVQIQSEHPGSPSRIELTINGQLQRSDLPENGRVLQQWTPVEPGTYNISVQGVTADNEYLEAVTRTVTVVNDSVISYVAAPVAAPLEPALGPTPAAPPPAPAPVVQSQAAGGSAFQPPAECAFNAPNAPALTLLTLNGINLPAQPGDAIIELPDETGQELTIDWNVTNADAFLLNISNEAGVSRSFTSQNSQERIIYTAPGSGIYTITFNARNGDCSSTITRQVRVKSLVIAAAPQVAQVAAPPTPTPVPTPTITPTPFYPPPPPIPGVPKGPTQDQLPELRPPVCDGADFIDVYVPPTSQRITISEPDMIPAKTVGGTLVHRAWRLQNTGTCTWGPGYELAFYGGRSMGSGGVAFESFFPNEPGRRNTIISGDRVIAPEGKPNQIAVLEVLLNAPVTPGIHQSYWRMRNPQGIYFGPILGVTLEVVRQCDFGIYGAPVINKFEILGVGNVYRPTNPIDVVAELSEPVTLEWDLINAESYDIIVRGPTGSTTNLSTGSTNDRNSFIPNQVGNYLITLYADNGPCTASANVNVEVFPKTDDPTSFIYSANRAGANALAHSWDHKDTEVNSVYLYAQRLERTRQNECIVGSYSAMPSFARNWVCQENVWSEWQPVNGPSMPASIVGVMGSTLPAEIMTNPPDLAGQATVQVGSQMVGAGAYARLENKRIGVDNAGISTVTNVEWGLCPQGFDPNDPNRTVDYGIRYWLRAVRNNNNAVPEWTPVPVDVRCYGTPTQSREINQAGAAGGAQTPSTSPPNPPFNPD